MVPHRLGRAGRAFLALAGAAALSGCQTIAPVEADGSTLIRNVTVISMEKPGSAAAQDLLIVDGRVAAQGAAGTLRRASATVIDGTGRYVIPGMWDMHTHALLENRVVHTLTKYADHGVVGVRDLGSTLEELQSARDALKTNADLPEVVAAGPLLDGPRQPWMQRMALPLADVSEARAAAERLASAGVDFLKVYNNLSREQFAAVAEVARARGLPFAGHVPFRLSLEEVSAAGQASIEHAGTQLVADCIEGGQRAIPAELNAWISRGYPGRSEERLQWWAKRDIAGCRALYRRMAARQTWVTPTLTNEIQGVTWSDESIALLPARQAEACRSNLKSINSNAAVRDAADQLVLDLVRELAANGVPLLAGTDVPNGCLAPGDSLHLELELMVRAGLSSWEALKTATRNPALFLKRPQEGLIRVGAVANLVLLDRNPLNDIRNTRSVAGVMLRGKWHRKPQPNVVSGL